MNRQQLVAAVGRQIGDEEAAETAVAALCETIVAAVARGESVEVEGFGRFSRVQRPPAMGAPATYVPRFDPDPDWPRT